MRKRWLARFAGLALLSGILVLATRVDVQTRRAGDSSVSGRLTALLSCVLPAAADDPPSTPAAVPEPPALGCDDTMPDRLGTPRMTAC
jgi:hypothetical protein